MTTTCIEGRLRSVRAGLGEAAGSAGRDPATVHLLAVSKTRGAAAVRAAWQAGVTDFGENYVAEAEEKMAALADLDIAWHFIGAIQSNKTRVIARRFHWVHTVDRAKIARRLSEQRGGAPLNVCVQVNVDAEPQKAGVDPDGLAELLAEIDRLDQLELRGLMTLPRPSEDVDTQRLSFRRLAELFARHRAPHRRRWDTLSMGMSGDYRAAIAEGATWVRIGTAIFGSRDSGGEHGAS